MTRNITTLASFCLLLMLTGCAGSQPSNNVSTQGQPQTRRIKSADVVKATAQPAEIGAGASGNIIVELAIDDGYHVNANPPTYPYLKATELEMAATEGVSMGSVSYPPPLKRQFPFAEESIAVYEGKTTLKATVNVDKSAQPGQRSIPAVLRIQACDDKVCYPPGSISLQIPMTIK